MIKTPFTGGCICGAVRYECSAAAADIQMFKCHCRDCQHVSGGGYTPVIYVPAATFKITRGTLRYFKTDSELMGPRTHQRGFCPDCGSRLTGGEGPDCGSRLTGGEGPDSTGIGMTAGSLDDPGVFKPTVEMWASDAQPWDPLDPSLPRFEKYPPF